MTKTLLAAALLALMAGLTLAQASQAKTTAKTNTAAKAGPAKTAAKPTAKKEVVAKAKPTSSRQQLHTAANHSRHPQERQRDTRRRERVSERERQ